MDDVVILRKCPWGAMTGMINPLGGEGELMKERKIT
jgi:hypothetical protein